MENIKTKLLVVISLALLVCTVGTCEFTQLGKSVNSIATDTSAIHNVRIEMLKVLKQQSKRIEKLQLQNDSLRKLVSKSKISLVSFRFKAIYLEQKLKHSVTIPDTTSAHRDTLREVVHEYIESRQNADSLCDETISGLERIICNQDSTIRAHEQIEKSMINFQTEQERRVQNLTEQINIFHKDLKRKKRQTIVMRAGVFILSAAAATLLITQKFK